MLAQADHHHATSVARVDAALTYLRQSLWFLPAVFAAAALVGAAALLELDRQLAAEGAHIPFLFGGGVDGAREVLSTIATSMLTFTGLVFTVTMLVLQQASTQLSPRVLRTFLRDRGNQVVLGLFVATLLYTLVVLRYVRADDSAADEFVPGISIGVAFALLLASVGAFIYYIDHMAHAIRASSVIHNIAAEARGALDRLFPDDFGEPAESPAVAGRAVPSGTAARVVGSPQSGALVALDEGGMLEAARGVGQPRAGGGSDGDRPFVELVPMIGDYLPDGAPLFRVWGTWTDDDVDALQSAVHFGSERSVEQDFAFGFRQLVDIAARALSAGINDPTTAVQALDRIHDLLRHLVRRRIPSPIRYDPDGQARLFLGRPDWDDYVLLATEEIRLAGESHLQVMRRLRQLLTDVLSVAPSGRQPALRRALARLDASFERDLAHRTNEHPTSVNLAPGRGSPEG